MTTTTTASRAPDAASPMLADVTRQLGTIGPDGLRIVDMLLRELAIECDHLASVRLVPIAAGGTWMHPALQCLAAELVAEDVAHEADQDAAVREWSGDETRISAASAQAALDADADPYAEIDLGGEAG